ncbi:MAG: prepilin-type N-terminal cleavage/methylation domain-containing protein [Clostridiales Family XIII bacterium]|jgi:prepilin-type N-terminal cleavage/methylation domain-containing protein|nr:prepilin-type N-terminal cleavage/methylation domain-containing protein [Clostridiales Family XIII bacterium]
MNMILKKRLADARSIGVVIRRRTGFTLVEVIVVLVILAILAAIAIPALTGYIDKAEDKKWIAEARNAVAACRTVLNEAYADETISEGVADSSLYSNFLNDGDYAYPGVKFFSLARLSILNTGDPINWTAYYAKAAKLIGIDYPDSITEPGYWEVALFAPKPSSYTIVDAPAFMYAYYPEGYGTGIAVAYGLSGLNPGEKLTWNQFLGRFADSSPNRIVCDPSVNYTLFTISL